MVPSPDHRAVVDTAKSLTRTQQDALRAIAFFRRQKKVGKGWLVGDRRLSERIVERLEQLATGGGKFCARRTGAAIDRRRTSDQGPLAPLTVQDRYGLRRPHSFSNSVSKSEPELSGPGSRRSAFGRGTIDSPSAKTFPFREPIDY